MEKAGVGKAKIPAFRSIQSAATYLLELSIVAAIYVGLAESGLFLPSINPVATPLWPPTGFALALVLLRGYRIWPAILVGSLSSYLMAARSLLESSSIVIGTLLAALAGAWLISRWSSGHKTFATPSSIAKFALISFAPVAIISSSLALAGFILANNVGFADTVVTWATWWLADATATLIIAPVVVLWAMTPLRPFSKWSLLETVAVIILATAIGIVAYSPLISSDLVSLVSSDLVRSSLNGLLPYRSLLAALVLAPLMWAGLRGNQRNVATTALIFFGIAVWGFSAGSNPFPKADLKSIAIISIRAFNEHNSAASHFGRGNCHTQRHSSSFAFYARPIEP